MTPEEAKQLKDGDHILIEGIVRNIIGKQTSFCDSGKSIGVRYKNELGNYYDDWLCVSNIREKLPPPRRKYREGDIVRWGDELREVQFFNPVPMVGLFDGGDEPEWCEADEVELVCAVEDRTDRKEDA